MPTQMSWNSWLSFFRWIQIFLDLCPYDESRQNTCKMLQKPHKPSPVDESMSTEVNYVCVRKI